MKLQLLHLALLGAVYAADDDDAKDKGKAKAAAAKPLVYPAALMDAITIDGLLGNEQQLQDFANTQDPPNRVFGGLAHNLTVNYIFNQVQATGAYDVEYQKQVQTWSNSSQSFQLNGKDIAAANGATYGPSGDVTAAIAKTRQFGCRAQDFPAAVSGKIALISRGNCTFSDKVANAGAAGAAGAIIYNNERGLVNPTLGTVDNPLGPYVPVIFIRQKLGNLILQRINAGRTQTGHIVVDAQLQNRTTYNVIATTKSGNKSNIITLGAHTDSVNEGPGINDNGSGTSGLLEVAKALAGYEVTNAVRFGWWTAEEFGLLGSTFYVASLSDDELTDIVMNLNFDMIASPNYVYSIYDGDGSAFNTTGPPGSAEIEALFEQYFDDQGQNHIATAFDGRSDYGPFLEAGIPAGGLFTGAEEIKTQEQQELFGGFAGDALDLCYHQACDNIRNLNSEAFLINAKAIAFATGRYARSIAGFPSREERAAVRANFLNNKRKSSASSSHVHAVPTGNEKVLIKTHSCGVDAS